MACFCMEWTNWILVYVCAFHIIFLYNLQAHFCIDFVCVDFECRLRFDYLIILYRSKMFVYKLDVCKPSKLNKLN